MIMRENFRLMGNIFNFRPIQRRGAIISIKSIVFIQMTGGRTKTGIGGGLVFQELLAKNLLKRGYSVYAITNPSDLYGFSFLGDHRYSANFKNQNSGVSDMFLFNRKKLKSELSGLVKIMPEDSVYVTVDPFPADISAASFLKNKLQKKTVVTMYHITPSPLFHPIRRGIARSVVAWLISINALLFVKLHKVPIFLDNKRIATSTGWKFSDNLMELPLSLEKYAFAEHNERQMVGCYVGRLTKNKGIADLIEAWRLVIREVPDAQLMLVGKDYGRGMYQKIIKKYHLESSVFIKNYIDEDAKIDLLRTASLFTFPSYEEGWSLAVIEAIDLGALPIVYDLPAYDYICINAIKIKVGDIRKFANTVIYFLTHPEDRSSIVEEIQKCIEKYTPEYTTDFWVEQICQVFYCSI